MQPLFVIAGLDPAIHAATKRVQRISMDHRVKPGGDKEDLQVKQKPGEGPRHLISETPHTNPLAPTSPKRGEEEMFSTSPIRPGDFFPLPPVWGEVASGVSG